MKHNSARIACPRGDASCGSRSSSARASLLATDAGSAVAALAVATTGWMFGPTSLLERALCVPAAFLLLYLVPTSIALGYAVFAVAVVLHLVRRRMVRGSDPTPAT